MTPPSNGWRWAAALGAVVLVAGAWPVAANHPQTDSGKVIVFDHVAGNEWWVEVSLSGQDAGSVASVEAQDTNGQWTALAKKSWGPYAASFHIEPGNQVRFRTNWAGGAQQVSCWFSHPQGVESCGGGTPPPPGPTWTASRIGSAGQSHGHTDIAVGQVGGRLGREVFVPAPSGLAVLTWTSSGWVAQTVFAGNAGRVAVGPLRGGDSAAYVSTYDEATNSAQVHVVSWDGVRWASNLIFSASGAEVTGLSLGDVEDGGMRELYVITGHPHALSNGVGYNAYQIKPNPTSPGLLTTRIATTSAPTFPVAMETLWAGDGNNDGNQELYVAGPEEAYVWRVDVGATGWTVARVDSALNADAITSVVVGDPDRDGSNEVYALARYNRGQDSIWQMRSFNGGIATSQILLGSSSYNMNDLFYGDGDSDGKGELYVTTSGGHLLQLFHDGTQWRPVQVADVHVQPGGNDQLGDLAVGDGDNDGKNEAYATGFDFSTSASPLHNVYRIGTTQPPPPPTSGAFDATFTGVRGNEWWVQVGVTATGETIAKVDVSLNGGTWKALAKQSWGGYAASYRAVEGTSVQFRATSATGATDLSDCYRWIPASNTDAVKVACGTTPPPPPPPAGFDATFTGVKGNNWWVQANVAANQPLAGVDVRVNCASSWKPLTKQSWGGWAASFNIPTGSKVDFAARSTSGAADASGGYIWPQATATSGCAFGTWPQQGSYVTYDLQGRVGGGTGMYEVQASLTLNYRNGAWTGTCIGRSSHYDYNFDPVLVTTVHWTDTVSGGPMRMPAATTVGATHVLTYYHASYSEHTCDVDNSGSDFALTVVRQEDHLTAMKDSGGAPITLRAWYADNQNDPEAWDNRAGAWDTKLGLVLDWDRSGRRSGQGSFHGDVVATDAPLR